MSSTSTGAVARGTFLGILGCVVAPFVLAVVVLLLVIVASVFIN